MPHEPTAQIAATFEDQEVLLRKRFGVRAGWLVATVFGVGCLLQVVGYAAGARQGVIDPGTARVAVALNALLAGLGCVFSLIHRNRLEDATDAGFRLSARIALGCAIAITLSHSHLAGSHSTGIILILVPVLLIVQRTLGPRDAWIFSAASGIGFLALTGAEAAEVLTYAPLLQAGPELRIASTHPLQTIGLLIILAAVLSVCLLMFQEADTDRRKAQMELNTANLELQHSQDQLRKLQAFLPMCSGCKAIRTEDGHWGDVEAFIQSATSRLITHSICPECVERLYPDLPLDG